MNCNQHQDTAATSVCRNCFRGVCSACAMSYADGTACSPHCFEKAQATTRVIENSVLAQRGARFGRYFGPVFMILLGTLFLIDGLQHGIKFRLDTLAGLIFFSLGVALGILNVRYFKPLNRQRD